MENEDGFWVIDEDTHEEGFVSFCTQKVSSGYLVQKGSPARESLEESPRREGQKVSREKGKEKDLDFVPGQKAKDMHTMMSINSSRQTQSFMENSEKEKERKVSSKKRKAKEKMRLSLKENDANPSQANVASSQQQQPSTQEEPSSITVQAQPYQEEGGGYQSEWTDWSAADQWHGESYYGQYEGKVVGHIM